MITEELKNFTHKVSGDVTKITQAHNTEQENTGKLIENAILQALTKAQSTTLHPLAQILEILELIMHTPYETSWTSAWPTSNHTVAQKPEINMHQIHRHCEEHTPPQTYINQQHPSQIPVNLNQSAIELFRHQNELTHSTQCLQQQTTDVLNNITKSSSLQENLHFINDIPIFKAKDL